ncbi:unnamed protein product [Caretta caretta]
MRRSKEDMFRELLQSSDQAKSEHRAWRETINEKLEMDSQERRQAQEQVIKLMQDQTEMLWSLIVLQGGVIFTYTTERGLPGTWGFFGFLEKQ